MKNLIKKLTSAYGPSGRENTIADIIKNEIKDLGLEILSDNMGNLIVVKKGSGKKIMVSAHMDEIGLIVTNVDDKGFIRFSNVGGQNPNILLGSKITFENGICGIIGIEHLENKSEIKQNKLFIDIGAKSKKEALERVKLGDIATFYPQFIDLGRCLTSKALDDRVGCAILIETIKRVIHSENEVYFVFTVQEEVGLRGARTAAYRLNPEIGIAVDVTATGDTPESLVMDVALGKGPAIKVMDRSVICHPFVKDGLIKAAEDMAISYQLEILERGGTDAGAIHITREGIPSGAVSIPCRYIHSASEMVDINDVTEAVNLLSTYLNNKF